MKPCSKCGERKPLCEFFKKVDARDGHMSQCKICSSSRVAEWKIANTVQARAQNRVQKREQSQERDFDFCCGVKTCTKCSVSKPLSEFSKKASSRDGFQLKCKACASIEHIKRRCANPEKVRAQERATKIVNAGNVRARVRAYAKANPEKVAKGKAAWQKANMHKVKAATAAWQKANRHMVTAATARYRAAKMQQTPNWLTASEKASITRCYELACVYTDLFGVKVHVDHVIPLRGVTVRGLHVPWNLRVMIAVENMQKNASYRQDDALSTTLCFEDVVGDRLAETVSKLQ